MVDRHIPIAYDSLRPKRSTWVEPLWQAYSEDGNYHEVVFWNTGRGSAGMREGNGGDRRVYEQ